MRPPATTGCVPPDVPPGSPKAHFNFSRGTSLADSFAASAAWNRVFVRLAPQPFQLAPASDARNGVPLFPQNADAGMTAGSFAIRLPDKYSASTRRCTRERSAAIAFIDPFFSVSRICSGLIRLMASRRGARASPPSWHVAQ
jgi:hypothetical protein